MLQVDATPICGLAKSESLKPTAWSMARLGARDIPSTTWEENARFFLFVMIKPLQRKYYLVFE
jgi:hypothetical protein